MTAAQQPHPLRGDGVALLVSLARDRSFAAVLVPQQVIFVRVRCVYVCACVCVYVVVVRVGGRRSVSPLDASSRISSATTTRIQIIRLVAICVRDLACVISSLAYPCQNMQAICDPNHQQNSCEHLDRRRNSDPPAHHSTFIVHHYIEHRGTMHPKVKTQNEQVERH